jgi:hypothetical protein
VIDGTTSISAAIRRKGEVAGIVIDGHLCDDGERSCCPGTSLLLEAAARLKGKLDDLPVLLRKLNELPDM